MVLGIIMVGWIVGVVGTVIAVMVGDPGVLGAFAVYVVSSVVGCLAAAMMVASRPERGSEEDCPGAAAARRSARPAATPAKAAVEEPALVEASAQRPS
jgi:hypothetical protein